MTNVGHVSGLSNAGSSLRPPKPQRFLCHVICVNLPKTFLIGCCRFVEAGLTWKRGGVWFWLSFFNVNVGAFFVFLFVCCFFFFVVVDTMKILNVLRKTHRPISDGLFRRCLTFAVFYKYIDRSRENEST